MSDQVGRIARDFKNSVGQLIREGGIEAVGMSTDDNHVRLDKSTFANTQQRALSQVSMPGVFPSMDEHVEMVIDAVRNMAGDLVDQGLTVKAASSIEIAGQFTTPEGVLMDAVFKIAVKAQPAKVE